MNCLQEALTFDLIAVATCSLVTDGAGAPPQVTSTTSSSKSLFGKAIDWELIDKNKEKINKKENKRLIVNLIRHLLGFHERHNISNDVFKTSLDLPARKVSNFSSLRHASKSFFKAF